MKNYLIEISFKIGILTITSFGISSNATGSNVKKIQFEYPFFADTLISARLEGVLSKGCSTISNVSFEKGPSLDSVNVINFFVDIERNDEECILRSKPFSHSSFLGQLDEGEYQVNVFENNSKTLSTRIVVPNDINFQNHQWDFNYNDLRDVQSNSSSQSNWFDSRI